MVEIIKVVDVNPPAPPGRGEKEGKEKRYEVFCEDFSYLVNAESLMEALYKWEELFTNYTPFAVVEQKYLEGKFLKIGEVRDEGLAGLF